jgi:hypothetical protein
MANLAALGRLYIPGIAKHEALQTIQEDKQKQALVDAQIEAHRNNIKQEKVKNRFEMIKWFQGMEADDQQKLIDNGFNPIGDPDTELPKLHTALATAAANKTPGSPNTGTNGVGQGNTPPTPKPTQIGNYQVAPITSAIGGGDVNTEQRPLEALDYGANRTIPAAFGGVKKPVVARATNPGLAGLGDIAAGEYATSKAFNPNDLSGLVSPTPDLAYKPDPMDAEREQILADIAAEEAAIKEVQNKTYSPGVMRTAGVSQKSDTLISNSKQKLLDLRARLNTNTDRKQLSSDIQALSSGKLTAALFLTLHPDQVDIVKAIKPEDLLGPKAKSDIAATNARTFVTLDGNSYKWWNGERMIVKDKFEVDQARIKNRQDAEKIAIAANKANNGARAKRGNTGLTEQQKFADTEKIITGLSKWAGSVDKGMMGILNAGGITRTVDELDPAELKQYNALYEARKGIDANIKAYQAGSLRLQMKSGIAPGAPGLPGMPGMPGSPGLPGYPWAAPAPPAPVKAAPGPIFAAGMNLYKAAYGKNNAAATNAWNAWRVKHPTAAASIKSKYKPTSTPLPKASKSKSTGTKTSGGRNYTPTSTL